MEIRVIRLELVSGYGNVRAFVDVEYGGIVIRNIKVVQQKGYRPYVRLPEASFIGQDGKKKYVPVMKFADEETQEKFRKVILTAYKEALEERIKQVQMVGGKP